MKNILRLFVVLAGLLLWEAIVDAQQVIFLVRHTEQAGVSAKDPPLTDAGKERAKRLTHILKDAGINQIFVTKWKRTIQTAEPLSKSLKIDTKAYERDDIDGLVTRLRTEHPRDRVLIIAHSRPMTPLLKALGHPEEIEIAPLEYDNLFVVIPKDEGTYLSVRMRY